MTISNVPKATIVQSGAAINDPLGRMMWYGWMDYHDGLGYRKDYDTWQSADQGNYERGRCAAATVKHEWGVVPDWNPLHPIGRNLKIVTNKDVETCMAMNEEFKWQNTEVVHVMNAILEPSKTLEPARQRRDARARTVNRREAFNVMRVPSMT